MSVVIETIVYCDGCGENFNGDDRHNPAWMIRKARKEDGWVQRGKRDYCERCKDKPENKSRRELENESRKANS